MGKRLSAKHKKMKRDKAREYATDPMPWQHKIAIARSKKAKKKNANRMT